MADVFESKMKRSYDGLKKRKADQVDVPDDRKFLGFDAYKKAIDSDVDVVLLTTPPHFRPAQLKAAIDRVTPEPEEGLDHITID